MGYTGYDEYLYEGPVEVFGKVVARHWSGTTYAPSEKKARSNLAYRYKKDNDMIPGTRVTLPGKITVLKRKE
jgi:hypothetical protein